MKNASQLSLSTPQVAGLGAEVRRGFKQPCFDSKVGCFRWKWRLVVELATYERKWQRLGSELCLARPTYVYGEALGVLQITEDFIRGQSNAFIHGLAAGAPVKSDAFRHGRYCWTQRAWRRRHVTPARPIRTQVQATRPRCEHETSACFLSRSMTAKMSFLAN